MGKYMLPNTVRLRFVWGILSLVALATMILAACGGGTATTPTPTASQASPTTAASPTSAAVMHVKIVENNGKYSFDPATLSIPKGTQVIWTNMSDAPHTVTSDTNAFATTSNLTEKQTFMFTFTTAGTYAYHCNVHPYMKATITVTS